MSRRPARFGAPGAASPLAPCVPLVLLVGTASCLDRDAPAGATGDVRLQLGGSGLSDEWRSLRAVVFDLARQGCRGPSVADPDAAPLATSGLAHPDALRLTLSVPAGPRTIYVEVYRDTLGLDVLGTGCAEAVLSPGQQATVQIEVVLIGGDADADGDADGDAGPDADGDADGDDVGESETSDEDGGAEDGEPEDAPFEDAVDGPDAPPSPGLVLSEIDYDQTGTDTLEFVELFNAGSEPVACSGLALRFINGVGSAVYLNQPLTCSWIDVGSLHVVASSLLRASISCPSSQVLGSGGNDLIQNGPSTGGGAGDAVALVDTSGGTPIVLDQIAYEGTVSGWGEGAFAIGDDPTEAVSLQRDPPGDDTGDNAADFALLPATPCATP